MGKAALAIKKNIAVIKDFPIKGISFQDIFSITRKPEIFKLIIQEIITKLVKLWQGKKPKKILNPEK